jgi:RND family efflux transporter MFP subunit
MIKARPVWPIAVLTLLIASCQEKGGEPQPQLNRPVLIERVRYEAMTPERSFVATIRPRVESGLAFRVPGKVAQRLVSVGDAIVAGQPLATLDAVDLRLQQEQAEAERAAASASLTQAQAELRRMQTLSGNGWSTAASLERQQAATEEARSRLTRAERTLSLARNAFSYATLVADADGVVTETLIEPGQMAATDKVAIRLARLAEKEAVVAVPETMLSQVRAGSASVTLWSSAGSRYAATLRELSPSADSATRTFLARYALAGAGPEVQLGMTATVTVADPAGGKVARLPLSALHNQGAGPALWVVDVDGRLVLRPVTVASFGARDVLITGGVAEGDQVVALGVQKLDAGQRVRVVQTLQL